MVISVDAYWSSYNKGSDNLGSIARKIRIQYVNLLKVPRIIRYTTHRRCVRLIYNDQQRCF